MSKVCVVGAGLAGVSAAYFLKQKGYDVTVVEAKPGVALGATQVSLPILRQAQPSFVSAAIPEKVKSSFCPYKFICGLTNIGDKANLNAFYSAFGFEFFRNVIRDRFVSSTEKICRLTATNYTLVLNMIDELKFNMPVNFGYLKISDDRIADKASKISSRIYDEIYEENPVIHVNSSDATRMFPPAQNSLFDIVSAAYEPTTAVVCPITFTRKLADVCKEQGVNFVFDTQILGFELNEDKTQITRLLTRDQEIPVDNIVLASGFSSFSLTDGIVDDNALVPLFPIRSVSIDCLDSTPNNSDLPSLFPTKPLTYLDQVILAEDQTVYPSSDDIVAKSQSDTLIPYTVSAVEFGRVGSIVTSDPLNPRKFNGYVGRDTGYINEVLPKHHVDPFTELMNVIRKVPAGAFVNTTFEQDERERRKQDQEIVSSRRISIIPRAMALHTNSLDGVPVIGAAPHISNLFFNTAHGANPFSTAVAGGSVLANVMADKHGMIPPKKTDIDVETAKIITKDIHNLSPIINVDDYAPTRFTPSHVEMRWFTDRYANAKK